MGAPMLLVDFEFQIERNGCFSTSYLRQYQHCLALHFVITFCHNVHAIVSDNDINLTNTIDDALVKAYPNAVKRACSWHLSDRAINTAQSSWIMKKHISKYVKEWFC